MIVTVGGGGAGLLLARTDAATRGEAFDDEHDIANMAMRHTASVRAKRLFHPARLPNSSRMPTCPKEVTYLFIHALSGKPRGTEIGDTGANAIEVARRERVSTRTGL